MRMFPPPFDGVRKAAGAVAVAEPIQTMKS
jgi:hypothetical protein